MKKRGVSRKFLTVALALGLLANAGGKPAFAKDREVIAKAADLPVQFPTKYELVVNHRTAKALGLTVF